MRFTVVWERDVQQPFIDQWVNASSGERARLTAAADLIDRELAAAPDSYGRALPWEPGARVWILPSIDPPITVVYRVSHADRVVRVVRLLVTLH